MDALIQEAVLAACVWSSSPEQALMLARPEDFTVSLYRVIFEAIRERFLANEEIDLLMLAEHLRRTGKLDMGSDESTVLVLHRITSNVAELLVQCIERLHAPRDFDRLYGGPS